MTVLNFNNVYNKILRHMTALKWLQKNNISKDLMDDYLKSERFVSALKAMVAEKDFSCGQALRIMKSLMLKITSGEAPKDWLNYLYQYALSKSFEDAPTIKMEKKFDNACEVFLRFLRLISIIELSSDNGTWQSRYPIIFLSPEEQSQLEYPAEYKKFVKAFDQSYAYEMMKLSQEVMGFNTLDHICGVHYLAMNLGRQLKKLDVSVDLGRVSGAAGGHDIGKYGCKGAEVNGVPRLHYYYTDQWFKRHGINYIRNIAINHSTWDLELENLSVESLILIYCDFRVKNDVSEPKPQMKIYSLEDAFHVILSKLENVDEVKSRRYKKVYAKLKDFEDYIRYLGVNPEPDGDISPKPYQKQYALLQGQEIVENTKYTAIRHNINLMYQLRDEYSLEKILEDARSERDWRNLREYIRILEEYSTYLTQKQKLQTIHFLYDNLTHTEDDIRRQCAELIGTLIAFFDEEYRKEIPSNGKQDPFSVTSKDLFRDYLDLLLMPSHKLIPLHRFHVKYSLSILVNSVFSKCNERNKKEYIEIMMEYYKDLVPKTADMHIFLLETVSAVPVDDEACRLETIFKFISSSMDKRNANIRLQALETVLHILPKIKNNSESIGMFLEYFSAYQFKPGSAAEKFLIYKILMELGFEEAANYKNISELPKSVSTEIFLSNMKTETQWVMQRNQIDLLLEYSLRNPSRRGLHAAIHFSNLLKVSEIECVRRRAGQSILALMPYLSPAERNEVAIELLRARELDGNRFTEYIPYYAGQVMLWLDPKELDECIEDEANKIKISNSNLKSLILKTSSTAVSNYNIYKSRFEISDEENDSRLVKMLGILLNGLGSYDPKVKQTAFSAIGKDIFGSPLLTLEDKLKIFKLISKKMLTLITDSKDEKEKLLFFSKAAGFNHIYRFISDYILSKGSINIDVPQKIAFFPGTFDPFSISHKEITISIRDLGFEVYLAVDDFSWSKKTLPNLLRKYIMNMSVSDKLGIYIYPDIYPTNISNPENLQVLKDNFSDSEVYIAVGSDVVLNASAYKSKEKPGSVHHFPHIIFERDKNRKLRSFLNNIHGDKIILSLSPKNKHVSSSQIRDYIDANKDISSLVDPMAQQYIYKNGFYQRESQDKIVLEPMHIETQIIDQPKAREFLYRYDRFFNNHHPEILDLIKETFEKPSGRILLIKDTSNDNILALSIFHCILSANMYNEFNDKVVATYIRQNRVGRILLIDSFKVLGYVKNLRMEQLLVNETLAHNVADDFEYAVYREILRKEEDNSFDNGLYEMLRLYGFTPVPGTRKPVYVTDMSHPCVLNLDIENIIKEPFRSNPQIKQVIQATRKKLQEAIVGLYPGKLLLSFDINYMNQAIIKKICKENNVPAKITEPRKLGNMICVPYGDILDRFIIPNTITKALHTEKVFDSDMQSFNIQEFPHYLKLDTQVKVIKAFSKPVILVDNILHKGYRIRELDPIFKKEDVYIKKIICGIMSGRGKDIMDIQGREVESAYFIPKLNLWFNETALYPFIGGDALWRGAYMERNLLPSVNLILPYTSPVFIRNTGRKEIFNLSQVSINNSIDILSVIEEEFHSVNEKKLNLSSLGQVFTVPRCPDHGKDMRYDLNLNATHYLKNDLEQLLRLETFIKE